MLKFVIYVKKVEWETFQNRWNKLFREFKKKTANDKPGANLSALPDEDEMSEMDTLMTAILNEYNTALNSMEAQKMVEKAEDEAKGIIFVVHF